jgi:hypothetical protein
MAFNNQQQSAIAIRYLPVFSRLLRRSRMESGIDSVPSVFMDDCRIAIVEVS